MIERFIYWLYRKTPRYYEGLIHDSLCRDLLDSMGAPRRMPGSKLDLGVYGRLRQFCINHDFIKPEDVL